MFGQGFVKVQERRGEKRAGSWALLQGSSRREPTQSTARGQFEADESVNPRREPSRASPRRGNRHRSPNRPEYACASDGGGVGGYRGLQRCSESWSSPPVHPRHLATRRRGQRRRGEPQAAWRGMRHFDAKPSVPWEPFIPHCGGSKRTGSRANRGRGSRSWHSKKPQAKVFRRTDVTTFRLTDSRKG